MQSSELNFYYSESGYGYGGSFIYQPAPDAYPLLFTGASKESATYLLNSLGVTDFTPSFAIGHKDSLYKIHRQLSKEEIDSIIEVSGDIRRSTLLFAIMSVLKLEYGNTEVIRYLYKRLTAGDSDPSTLLSVVYFLLMEELQYPDYDLTLLSGENFYLYRLLYGSSHVLKEAFAVEKALHFSQSTYAINATVEQAIELSSFAPDTICAAAPVLNSEFMYIRDASNRARDLYSSLYGGEIWALHHYLSTKASNE